jgi:hypothetical protein
MNAYRPGDSLPDAFKFDYPHIHKTLSGYEGNSKAHSRDQNRQSSHGCLILGGCVKFGGVETTAQMPAFGSWIGVMVLNEMNKIRAPRSLQMVLMVPTSFHT